MWNFCQTDPHYSANQLQSENSENNILKPLIFNIKLHIFLIKLLERGMDKQKDENSKLKYTFLHEYKVIDSLCKAVSGQGEVYLVASMDQQEYYCAKVYHNFGELQSQAAALKAVQSKYIVKYIAEHPKAECLTNEICENQQKDILMMQYAEGGCLHRYLTVKTRFSLPVSKVIYGWILAGLQAMHQKSVAHRDIKPENIVLDKNFIIKICDFGHAVFYEQGVPLQGKAGTKKYRAPEVTEQQSYFGEPADLYSATLVFFLVMIPNVLEIVGLAQKNDAQSRQKLGKLWMNSHKGEEIPQQLQFLFSRMFSHDPSERFTLKQLKQFQQLWEDCASQEQTQNAFRRRHQHILQRTRKARQKSAKKLQNSQEKQNSVVQIFRSGSGKNLCQDIHQLMEYYEDHCNVCVDYFPLIENAPWLWKFFMPPSTLLALI